MVIRVRPPLARELQGYRPFENAAIVDPNQRVITLSENLQSLTASGGQTHSPDNGMVCADLAPPQMQSLHFRGLMASVTIMRKVHAW